MPTVDVVIPAIRSDIGRLNGLLYSLGKQTRVPDRVTIISNELEMDRGESQKALPQWVKLSFTSDTYGFGMGDAGLRRNIGIWESPCDIIIFQDDDQMAPPTMVEDSLAVLAGEPYVWGHHRFTDFVNREWDDIRLAPMESGEPRENGSNKFHLYFSCYAGMFGAWKQTLLDVQGFDMVWDGHHGNEDQALGRKLCGTTAYIHEPPFTWHPSDRSRTWSPVKTNFCPEHEFEHDSVDGVAIDRCRHCPHWEVRDILRAIEAPTNIIPYDHSLVTVYQGES